MCTRVQGLGDFGSSIDSVEALLPFRRSVANISIDRAESKQWRSSKPLTVRASDDECDPW
jgi:hypothetical protein